MAASQSGVPGMGSCLFPAPFHANVRSRQRLMDGPGNWVPATHMDNLHGVLGCDLAQSWLLWAFLVFSVTLPFKYTHIYICLR